MFFAAPAFGQWDDVIEFDLTVLKVFSADLTSVVVSPGNPNLGLEWDVSSS